MTRITKKQLQERVAELQKENETLRQQVNTLEAQLNFYKTVEKGIADTCNGAGQFISSCLGWNLSEPKEQRQQQ